MDIEEIRLRMAERGMKVADLANAIGIDPNKVTKSLTGTRRWQATELLKLMDVLGAAPVATPTVQLDVIPIIGRVSAGAWKEAIAHPIDTIPRFGGLTSNAFGLELDGDSMDRLAPDGGIALVDPDDKALFPGRRYVVANGDGETTFKEFAADPARLIPLSNNPDHHEIILGEGETFTVIGRVCWVAQRA